MGITLPEGQASSTPTQEGARRVRTQELTAQKEGGHAVCLWGHSAQVTETPIKNVVTMIPKAANEAGNTSFLFF